MQLRNNSLQSRYTIMRGSKNVRDVGRVIVVNDKPLKVYKEHSSCNVINGTDGMYLPPFQHKKEILWSYSDTICKSLPLRRKYEKRVYGIMTTYKYLPFSDPLVCSISMATHFLNLFWIHFSLSSACSWTQYVNVINFMVALYLRRLTCTSALECLHPSAHLISIPLNRLFGINMTDWIPSEVCTKQDVTLT